MPKKLKIFLFCAVCCVLSTVLVGCAGGFARTESTITIGGSRYTLVSSVARNYNLKYQWDAISRKVTLSKSAKQVRLMAQSRVALLNDSVQLMPNKARQYQDSLLIPQDFVRRTIIPFFRRSQAEEQAPQRQGKLNIKTVIIDAGHGGKDPGAVGRGGLREKEVTLDIAKRLKKRLEAAGIKVIMTRNRDKFVSLKKRLEIANSRDADFFIAVHVNAARSRWVSGVEVFYLAESIDDAERSAVAAKNYNLNLKEGYSGRDTEAILWHLRLRENRRSSVDLAELISTNLSKKLSQRNRGRKPARFYVLKTNLPAVLVEVGFLTNAREEKRLKNHSYKNKITQGIVDGLMDYNKTLGQMRTARYR